MSDEQWVRSIEREMGALTERQRALDQVQMTTRADVSDVRKEMKEGFTDQGRIVRDGLARLEASIERTAAVHRGELDRVENLYRQRADADAEERKQKAKEHEAHNLATIEAVKAENRKLTHANRILLLGGVVALSFMREIVANWSSIMGFVGQVMSYAVH